MRRGLILLFCTVVLPAWLGIAPAAAQVQLNTYPGSVVDVKQTTITIANTTTAGNLYTVTIPPRYFQSNRQPFAGPGALHLSILGRITTNQGAGSTGNINVGCNYGGSTASIALVNAQAPQASLVNAPFMLDLWVRGQGTSTTSELVMGRLEIAPTQVVNASPSLYNAVVVGTTTTTANQTLRCDWMWGSAAATNSVTMHSAVLSIGE